MTDDPSAAIPDFNRLSLPAVVVPAGQDASAALAAAGLRDPVALPCVIGDDPAVADQLLTPGMTPHIRAVLEMPPRLGSAAAEPVAISSADDLPVQPVISRLPPAFGLQPLAPVRRRPG